MLHHLKTDLKIQLFTLVTIFLPLQQLAAQTKEIHSISLRKKTKKSR